MPLFTVEVGLATGRPPRADLRAWYLVDATDGDAAELLAVQWAAARPHVVMPVSAVVVDWDD